MGEVGNYLLVHVPALFYVILKYLKAQHTFNSKPHFQAYPVKYSSERKIFQIKLTDINYMHMLQLTECFYK